MAFKSDRQRRAYFANYYTKRSGSLGVRRGQYVGRIVGREYNVILVRRGKKLLRYSEDAFWKLKR